MRIVDDPLRQGKERRDLQNSLRWPSGNVTIQRMTLYLMRHAEAEPISTGVAARDAARPLTEKGCRQAERMGLLLKKLDVKIDRTLSSPFVRARKTAELVLAAVHSQARIQLLDVLQPDAQADAMWKEISRVEGDTILVVGHLPSIARLACSLLGNLADESLWFHKSSLAALHCASHEGRKQCFRMEWMISPAMTKRLASRHGSD